MDAKYPPGPPELTEPGEPVEPAEAVDEPSEASQPQPIQLIKSTKPVEPAPVPDDEAEEPDALNELVKEPGDPDGVHAAEEEKKWQESHPAPEPTPGATPKRRHPWLKALIVLLVIAAAGYGAFWYGDKRATDQTQTAKPPQTQKAKPSQPATVATKHYDSATYTLGFDYPEDWAVSDTTAKLTVTSPDVSLKGVDGAAANAHVVVTVQNPQTTIAGYPAAGAIAELASDKLTYKQPTSIQRAQTYLSYLGYHKTNGLDALYITGDNGYQQDQQVPMGDVTKGNPLVGVTFETCSSNDCASGTPTPVTLLATSWKDTPASKQVTDLLQSIQLN